MVFVRLQSYEVAKGITYANFRLNLAVVLIIATN
jgi:hypothetical protein